MGQSTDLAVVVPRDVFIYNDEYNGYKHGHACSRVKLRGEGSAQSFEWGDKLKMDLSGYRYRPISSTGRGDTLV
jgi:hypothetical protein